MSKTISPPAKPSRVSVPISPEAFDAFQRLAKAGNMSTGKAIATWLDDTIEAVQYTAHTMERARSAPKEVMREVHAYALGLADETGDLMNMLREKGRKAATDGPPIGGLHPARGPVGAAKGSIPPSCNTGGKLPKGDKPNRGGKS